MKLVFNARARGTDGSLLASLPWTLFALSFSLAAHVPYLPIWITATFAGCAAWRLFVEKQRRSLPSTWVRGSLALVCFLGVLGTYSAISGVGPGSALLAVMAALKLLETRQRRDQFVLLFISIFLVMSSLLREQYLWSLPYLVAGILVIMTAWLRMSADKSESARQSFRNGGRLLLYAAPLAIAMWVLFPRLASPFWAVPIDTSQATSGLSNEMSPGDISSLSLSDEVAFRVKFDGPIPEPRDRYWRGLVMTSFNGRTWRGWEPNISRSANDRVTVSGDPISYEITMEPTRQQWVFALDMPKDWDLPRTSMGRHQVLSRVHPIEQRIAYRATSYTDYFVESAPTVSGWYTDVPGNSNQRAGELAREMQAQAGSDTAFIEDVLAMFNQQEFFYTLEPPPLGSNPVDRFLFDTRRGFCEHYASAFAFMMRSAGIPSRIVLGYQGGEVNTITGHLVVRQSDAHAWTEVYLDRYGWYRVDPTAAVAPERIEYSRSDPQMEDLAASWGFSGSTRLMIEMTMMWDALNGRWNDWILGYGPEKQKEFLERLGLKDPDWRKMLLTLVLTVVGLVVLISALLMLRYRPPRKDRAARLYDSFVRRTGISLRTGETPWHFATRAVAHGSLAEADINAVTRAYMQARYGIAGGDAFNDLKSAIAAAR